jgi:hypothetical protein
MRAAAMKRKSLVLWAVIGVALLVAGCGANRPARWTDRQGAVREIVFTRGPGSDLYDAYTACHTDWDCYQAYFRNNQRTWKRRIRQGRGQIRLDEKGGGVRVYGEHYVNPWSDEIGASFCFLTLLFDAEGNITKADYEK